MAVLPSQLHTFYDIYCIIRVKLYHSAFSDKLRRYSIGDAIANKSDNAPDLPPSSGSNFKLAPPKLIVMDSTTSADESAPPFDKTASLNINWNKFLSRTSNSSEYVIQPCDGYQYAKTGPFDVVIDTDGDTATVSLHGRIRQCARKNGFFNDDKVSQILLTKAHPKDHVGAKVVAMCNDKKYDVLVTVNNDGIISCAISQNLVNIPDKMDEFDLWYIDLDGISYEYNHTELDHDHDTKTPTTPST